MNNEKTIYKCFDCGVLFRSNRDGLRCPVCGAPIVPIGTDANTDSIGPMAIPDYLTVKAHIKSHSVEDHSTLLIIKMRGADELTKEEKEDREKQLSQKTKRNVVIIDTKDEVIQVR